MSITLSRTVSVLDASNNFSIGPLQVSVFLFMKNEIVEKKVDLLDIGSSSTRAMNPLLAALERVVKADIDEEFRTMYRKVNATTKNGQFDQVG